MKCNDIYLFLLNLIFCVAGIGAEGFGPDTLIKINEGYITISDLQIGDFVRSYDRILTQQCSRKIINILTRKVDHYYELYFYDERVVVGVEQLIYVPILSAWISIEKFASGLYGKWLRYLFDIQAIVEKKDSVIIYQITTDEQHNFYVSKHDLLVHNMDGIVFPVLATATLGAEVVAGSVLVPIIGPLIAISFLGYKAGSYLFAKHKDKKLKQKNKNHKNAENSCCNDCAQGNSCTQTARKIGCTPEELHERKKEAQKIAKKMGFKRTENFSFDAHGEAVFTDGREFITIDNTCHEGGFWKKFIGKRRDGTYSKDLKIKIGN